MAKSNVSKESRVKLKRARDFVKERDIASARAELLEIEMGSSLPIFHRLLAACAYIDKDYDLAASHMEQAISLDPAKQVTIADAIRVYQKKGDLARASQLCDSFDLDKATSSSDLLRIALAMKALSKYPQALVALEKALRLSPENTRVRDQYGIILSMLERSSEAMQQWNFSLKYNPNDNQALVCLGRLYLHNKEFMKAIELFKEALSNDEGKKEPKKVNLIDAYIRNSSIADARSLLTTVDGMDSNPRFHYLWGMLHYRSGDLTLAYASLSRCIALGAEKESDQNSKVNWSDNCATEDEIKRLIESASPVLDSVFDPYNMLTNSQNGFESQSNDVDEFVMDS